MRLIVLLTLVSIGLLITSVAGAKEPKIEEVADGQRLKPSITILARSAPSLVLTKMA